MSNSTESDVIAADGSGDGYDDVSSISIHDKVQMIDITLNEINDHGYEDEEVECEVKPGASSSMIRYFIK